MRYFYFASSLPDLRPDAPPPMSVEAFRDACREHLSVADADALDAVLERRESGHAFVRAWLARETQLRSAVARIRAGRLKREVPEAREYEGFDGYAAAAAQEAFAAESPRERERVLDRYRWDMIEDLRGTHAFSSDAVLGYGLQLQLAERWAALDQEKGSRMVETVSSRPKDGQEGADSNE